jgi:hypothetical protein
MVFRFCHFHLRRGMLLHLQTTTHNKEKPASHQLQLLMQSVLPPPTTMSLFEQRAFC